MPRGKKQVEEAPEKARTLSAKLKKAIDGLKKPFLAYVEGFAAITQKRKDLAPAFMKAFHTFAAETGGSFPDFVRQFDPTVPTDRKGYRAHPAHAAADYLRRLENRRDTKENRAEPLRAKIEAMARLLATIQPLISDQKAFWKAVGVEFELTARQLSRLQRVVAASKPLLDLKVARVQPVRVVHVTPAEMREAAKVARPTAA